MLATTPEPDFRFPLRVYWEDTDAGGVVFYANYLKYFERARTEWLRSLGHGQEPLRVEHDTMFVVTDTSVRYRLPARLDDLLDVTVQLVHLGRARMDIRQQVWRRKAQESTLLAEGTIRIGCVCNIDHAGTFRPQRIPISILNAIRPGAFTEQLAVQHTEQLTEQGHG